MSGLLVLPQETVFVVRSLQDNRPSSKGTIDWQFELVDTRRGLLFNRLRGDLTNVYGKPNTSFVLDGLSRVRKELRDSVRAVASMNQPASVLLAALTEIMRVELL